MKINWVWLRKKRKNLLGRLKQWFNFTNTIILIGILTTIIYLFSFLFPFTDNAFVVNNIRPVAALTSGYLTGLYVKNGEPVRKGQKLFTVFKKPYLYKVEQLSADLAAGNAQLAAFKTTYERDQKLSDNEQRTYIKRAQDDKKYQRGYQLKSISLITLQNSQQETQAAKDKWEASLKQLEIDTHQIEAQAHEIKSLEAKLKNAV